MGRRNKRLEKSKQSAFARSRVFSLKLNVSKSRRVCKQAGLLIMMGDPRKNY